MGKKITLKKSISNVSVQVGDTAYFTSTQNTGGVINATTNIKKIGVITEINPTNIEIQNVVNLPSTNDFVMFSKDKSVNNTSLLGYYAEVKLSNN